MQRSKRIGTEHPLRLLVEFSVPAITGMLVFALYNVVDRIFIGQAIGANGIAGVTIAFPFVLIVVAFGMLIGLGATAVISMRLGQQDKQEAERVLGAALLLSLGMSVVLTVVGLLLLDPMLLAFGASEEVLPYAREYLRILLLGTVFQMLGFALNSCIRGEGNPRTAMYTMLIGAILNIALDPIFLFGFGMGIRGAAIATVISQTVSATWVLAYFFGRRSLLRLHADNFRLRWNTCYSILSVGAPPFAMQLMGSLLVVLLNNQLKTYGGDLAISTLGVVHSIVMIITMPIVGINQGAQPIIGYNYGARKFDRVRRTLTLAVMAATAVTTAGFSVTMLFPATLVRLFDPSDQALIVQGSHAMRICFFMMPVVGFQIVGANYFQAIGKPVQAMFLSLSRQLILLIPALLILPSYFGLNGVWAAIPVADLGASILTGIWLLFELRHLDERHAQMVSAALAERPPLNSPAEI